jgi:hypothetical protein
MVRKQVLRNLEANGMSRRAAEEALGADPRDLELKFDLKKLLQMHAADPFQDQPGNPDGFTSGPEHLSDKEELLAQPIEPNPQAESAG